jgi:hypothetical protein
VNISEPRFAGAAFAESPADFTGFVDDCRVLGVFSWSVCSFSLSSEIPLDDTVFAESQPSESPFRILMQLLVASMRHSWTATIFTSFVSLGYDLESVMVMPLHRERVQDIIASTYRSFTFLVSLGDVVKLRSWDLLSARLLTDVYRSFRREKVVEEHAELPNVILSVHSVDFSDFLDVVLDDRFCSLPGYLEINE